MTFFKVNTIKWHKENLKNRKENLKYLQTTHERLGREIVQAGLAIAFLELQIDEAIKAGKESFDAAKFRVKKEGK